MINFLGIIYFIYKNFMVFIYVFIFLTTNTARH